MYCIPVSVRRIYFQTLFLNTKTNAVLDDTTFVTHRLGVIRLLNETRLSPN
jgi:hypothetical protein